MTQLKQGQNIFCLSLSHYYRKFFPQNKVPWSLTERGVASARW